MQPNLLAQATRAPDSFIAIGILGLLFVVGISFIGLLIYFATRSENFSAKQVVLSVLGLFIAVPLALIFAWVLTAKTYSRHESGATPTAVVRPPVSAQPIDLGSSAPLPKRPSPPIEARRPAQPGDPIGFGSEPTGVEATVVTEGVQETVIERGTVLPDWVKETEMVSGDKTIVVMTSRQFATAEEGDAEIVGAAAEWVVDDFAKTYDANERVTISPALLKHTVYRRRFVETIDRQSGANSFRVYRVHQQVELSPTTRKVFFAHWRGQVVEQRLWLIGKLVGFFTVILGGLAVFLRVGARSSRTFRRPVAVIAAITLIGASMAFLLVLS